MHSEALTEKVSAATRAAVAFIERNGVSCFDSLDLVTHEASQRLLTVKTRLGTIARKALWAGTIFAPQLARECLGVKRRTMNSGVANLACAYMELGGADNIAKAKRWLQWLEENATVTPEYLGWGFPFPWKQKLLVLPGTPIGHTTMTCANAFLKFHQITGDQEALGVVRAAINFFHRGLRQSYRKAGGIALSYTPLDETHIINIQADIGSLLLRAGHQMQHDADNQLGTELLRCVLSTQERDGSWPYYASDTAMGDNFVDNHHTGMVLSALAEIQEEGVVPPGMEVAVEEATQKGTSYFLEQLFTADGTPKWLNRTLYPIDIYNFAQSIITLLDLRNVLPAGSSLAEAAEHKLTLVIERLVETMQKPDGGFLYRRLSRYHQQDLGSLRWANALTTAALARWLRVKSVNQSAKPTFQGA